MAVYRRWIVACTAGELVGIGTATLAALAMSAVVGEPRTLGSRLLSLAVFAAVGAVEGGALAAFQWRVLRSRLPRLRLGEWVGVTVALAVAGWIAGMTPSLFLVQDEAPRGEPALPLILLMAAGAGAGAGLAFGAAQWFVLRRHAERAGRWIWIHVPAWALAMAAIFLGASIPTLDWPAWAIASSGAAGGIIGGLLLGAVTGLVARDLRPWVDEQSWSLRGTVCAVTGGNAGIGYETALGLSRLGASVILLCRHPGRAERARRLILARQPSADVRVVACDLGNLRSVRWAAATVARDWPRLDVLVHNAGTTFPVRTLTSDGVEATLAVDVIGPFLLTALLRDRLEQSGGRVIALTGISHRRGRLDTSDLHWARRRYGWLAANNQAQQGRWLFISELARRVPSVTAVAVHPGAVLTGAQAQLPRPVRALVHTLCRGAFVRAEVGAIPVVRLAAHPDLRLCTGRFFDRCRVAADTADPDLAQRFWIACELLTSSERPSARAVPA